MAAVKASGIDTALGVAEAEGAGEDVGPERQPAHQIRRGFHDYEAAELMRSQALEERAVRQLAEDKASAKRVSAAVDQIAEFYGLKEKENEPQS